MSAPELPRPIDKSLGGDPDDAQVARMWAGIASRRSAVGARRRIAWRAAAGVLAVAAGVALVMAVRGVVGGAGAGPLAMRDGSVPRAWSVAESASPSRVELADGSAITLAAGTRVEAVENGADRFCVLLRSGRARFSVQPGGPRRWIVEAGLATVEVVGTVFEVTRDEHGVRVSVQRGVVVVRGERVPNRVQRLEVGESLHVPVEVAVREDVRTVGVGVAQPVAAVPPVAPALPAAPVAPVAAVQPVAAVPPVVPTAPVVLDYDALLDSADAARRSGRTADALALLDQVATSGDGPHAALASFTRAKLELSTTPHDAARDFERAIARGLPAPLDEEAHGRLVDAYVRAGRDVDARRAAALYLDAYPRGRLADAMRARAEAP